MRDIVMLPISAVETNVFTSEDAGFAHIYVLRGQTNILRIQPTLVKLCDLCGQAGAMDYLEHFLTSIENVKKTPHLNIKKTPHLLLFASHPTGNAFDLQARDLAAAVLLYEYRLLGFPSRVFISADFDSSRTVVAPAKVRPTISTIACRYLMEHGAQAVHVTFVTEPENSDYACLQEVTTSKKKSWWTTQTREIGSAIALEATVDATLATLGSHTRRNLRYYRRRAERELGCSFASDLKGLLTVTQLLELNRNSAHPVPRDLIECRFRTMNTLKGAFCVGVQMANGQWISLLGGRRHHGVTSIDWQMNHQGLAKYSVGTVIRAYLIEHEIAIGNRWLQFEGGTTHTIKHSFVPRWTKDIIVLDRSPFASLLRGWARYLPPGKNFLLQTLADQTLLWERH